MQYYDIAVQRAPFPWMTRFKAVDHFWSSDAHRLTIVTPEGDQFSFARMTSRRVRVYPNYRVFKQAQEERERRAKEAVMAERRVLLDLQSPPSLAPIEPLNETPPAAPDTEHAMGGFH